MTYLIIILFIWSLWHFAYQSIILPNERTYLRYRLFEVRDNIIDYEIENGRSDAVDILLNSTNVTIKFMHNLNLYDLIQSMKIIENDDKIKEHILNRDQIITSSSEQIIHLRNEIYIINGLAFSLNLGSWIPLFVPSFLLIKIFHKIFVLPKKIRNAIKYFTFIDEREYKNYSPLATLQTTV